MAFSAPPLRRHLVRRAVALLTLAMVAPSASFARVSDAASTSRPNIIFVLTDDQDALQGSIAYMQQTNELLAAHGITFGNMFVPLSLCCPSRTAILRGQFPHNTQVLTNTLPLGGFEKVYALNLESTTIATVLHDAGYRTVLLGKYLNGYPDTASPTYIPPGWDEWYSPAAGNPYSEYNYTLNENGTLVEYGSTPADYLTDVIYAKAVDFILRASRVPTQPLFIYLATYAPHSPYTPAPRHANLFPGVKAPRPPSFNEPDVSDKPAYIATTPLLTEFQITRIDATYRARLQALQAVDEAVAGLVTTLAATGKLANSYIFFSSDNGYHMGEHRMQPGKYTPYETDIRVPLIVRGPGVPAGVTRAEFAANVDFAETFAELAGVPPLPFSDGRSLAPLLQAAQSTPWRQAFLLEEFATGKFVLPSASEAAKASSTIAVREPPDAFDLAVSTATIPSYYGFQGPGYKYVEYATGEKELYVLADDPYELDNKASTVDPTIAAPLAAYLRTLNGCSGAGCRAADGVAPPPLLTGDFTVSAGPWTNFAPITFVATATGTAPYSFTWDFGGGEGTGASVVATLSRGTHNVTLRVVDAIGAEATVVKSITVAGQVRRRLK